MKALAHEAQLVQAFNVIDLAAGNNTGDRVNMKLYNHCEIIVNKEPGAVGEPITLTVLQHNAVTGGTSKALPIKHGVFIKSAATDLTSTGVFTAVAATTANTYALAAGDTAAVVVIPILAEDLDTDGGFTFLSLDIADPGATTGQLGAALYLLTEPRYTPPPSAIV